MTPVPVPQRKPIFSNSDDSIFGLLGDITDTAGELAADFFEFQILRDQARGLISSPSVVEANNPIPINTTVSAGGFSNTQLLTFGALGLAGVAAIAVLT